MTTTIYAGAAVDGQHSASAHIIGAQRPAVVPLDDVHDTGPEPGRTRLEVVVESPLSTSWVVTVKHVGHPPARIQLRRAAAQSFRTALNKAVAHYTTGGPPVDDEIVVADAQRRTGVLGVQTRTRRGQDTIAVGIIDSSTADRDRAVAVLEVPYGDVAADFLPDLDAMPLPGSDTSTARTT